MDPSEIHTAIAKLPGFSNVARVHHFQATRKLKCGGDELVDIEIHDAGTDCVGGRFTVIAKNEHGRAASGNPFDTIEPALACVHWHNLDES